VKNDFVILLKHNHQIKDVNAISHYWTIQAFVPSMIKKDKGAIVTIASNAAYFVAPNMVKKERKIIITNLEEKKIQNKLRIELTPEHLHNIYTNENNKIQPKKKKSIK
jgi:NAD(P)-dependent dehydrogenase (short-subunit alcohol dehydrogenase family)